MTTTIVNITTETLFMSPIIKEQMTIEELAETVNEIMEAKNISQGGLPLKNEDRRYVRDLSIRRIRDYVSKGIIEKPIKEGRNAYFTPEHCESLVNIRTLQAEGLSDTVLQKLGSASYYSNSVSSPASESILTGSNVNNIKLSVPLKSKMASNSDPWKNSSKNFDSGAWSKTRPLSSDDSHVRPLVADDGHVIPLTTDDSRVIPLTSLPIEGMKVDSFTPESDVEPFLADDLFKKPLEEPTNYLRQSLMNSSSFSGSLNNGVTEEGKNALNILRGLSVQGNGLLHGVENETSTATAKTVSTSKPSNLYYKTEVWTEVNLEPTDSSVFLKFNDKFQKKPKKEKDDIFERIKSLFEKDF